MQFLKGSKQEFMNFINNIKEEDNIAIITHTDLDGIASAIFLESILNFKNIQIKLIKFVDYKNDVLIKLIPKLKKENITKIFILDISIDSLALEDFEELRKEIPIFLIDHHPKNPLLKDFKNIIKAETNNCVAQVVYELGESTPSLKEQEWLLIPTLITEFSYKDKENMKFMQSKYPDINEKNLFDSEPGKIAEIINYSIIYYNDNLKKVYSLIKNNNIAQLKKVYHIIQEEIKKETNDFLKNAEYYPDKQLYFYYFNPKHRIKSIISTNLSLKNPECSFIIITQEGKDKNYLTVSARNQSKSQDMNQLMKKAIEGLENANGGGHVPAAGARILKQDLNKFKANLLK